jgi:hypothetical protein
MHVWHRPFRGRRQERTGEEMSLTPEERASTLFPLCPECGPGAKCDQDGLCCMCGFGLTVDVQDWATEAFRSCENDALERAAVRATSLCDCGPNTPDCEYAVIARNIRSLKT